MMEIPKKIFKDFDQVFLQKARPNVKTLQRIREYLDQLYQTKSKGMMRESVNHRIL
jgi:hypothetical protein